MERNLYNQKGSVDDIRCSLVFIDPKSIEQALASNETLAASIANEKENKNRATVIKMLESKKTWVEKKINTFNLK